uniref:Sushi domain-containing protein n=1 Tax=Anopheles maculatus TaxID=74869 RepID=A0A182SGF3_9DIPT
MMFIGVDTDTLRRERLARLATGETYEDCEQPPEIAHGSARLTVDDNEEYVTAHYTCKSGYRLQEPQLAAIRCSIETDEWEANKLPVCVPGEYRLDRLAQVSKMLQLKESIFCTHARV